jgi:hypothetical protein
MTEEDSGTALQLVHLKKNAQSWNQKLYVQYFGSQL